MVMMSPVHTFPTDISLADILCFDLLLLLLLLFLLLLVLLVNYKVTLIITCGKSAIYYL